jgi:preprotein translocase subunit SecF
MWLGIKREDLIKSVPGKKDEDPNDPNAGATV